MHRCAEVAVTVPVHGTFHYAIPEAWPPLEPGCRLVVPFARRQATAIVLQDRSAPPAGVELKQASERLDDEALVPADVIELCRFAARYYIAPLGAVFEAALPPKLTGITSACLRATERGRARVPGPGPEVAWLERAASGRLRARDVPEKIRRWLVDEGWAFVDRGLELRSPEDSRPEGWSRTTDDKTAWSAIARAPLKRDVWSALAEGPIETTRIVARHGAGARSALRAMEKAGIVARVPIEVADTPIGVGPELAPSQSAAVERIVASLDADEGRMFLLQGVTGSGKTEVYLRAVAHALAKGGGAIVLVPEIGLTPQLEARFKERFGERVATLHSGLTQKERVARWTDVRRGLRTVVLGPRSAVWAPVRDLRLVVVDEEHDGSYKQSADVRYNARDLALTRARRAGATAILGSATPSLESHAGAEDGRLERLRMNTRVTGGTLPKVDVVDISAERDHIFSRRLTEALHDAWSAGRQSILFLNRRGFSTYVTCGACQTVYQCPDCDVSLTLHRPHTLRCHYCGYSRDLRKPCTSCGAAEPETFGTGTQRITEALADILPEARIARLDRDAATTPKKLQGILSAFGRGEADVLVGTKMVTKGHDFPRVSLVGILFADASLAFPDFRAQEFTFQLLTQTAGRAGRSAEPGRVIVQTLQPEHPVIRLAVHHDTDGFLDLEMAHRQGAGYPPFGRVGLVRCESEDGDRAEAHIRVLAERARTEKVIVLGPTEAPIARVKQRFRYRFMVRSESPSALLESMTPLARVAKPSGVDVTLDVDAQDFL